MQQKHIVGLRLLMNGTILQPATHNETTMTTIIYILQDIYFRTLWQEIKEINAHNTRS